MTIPIVSQTNCPYLDYQKILEIAQSEDDFLESGTDTVALHPGTYNLILMDEDRYSFDGSSGDVIRLAVEKQNGSTQDMVISITDAAGNAVAENRIVTEDDPLELILSEAVPPYAIVLTQNDYSDPNIYTLKFDIQRNTTQTVPYIPKNGMWSGFALTNPGDTPVEDVTLTTYTEEGQPLQTLLGPMTMASGERQVFLFTDLPYRQHELSDTESLKLMADGDIRMVNLFASSSYERMSVFAQNSADNAETRIIIPDTRAPLDFSRSMSGAVMNKMFDDLLLNLRLYSEGGTLKKEILNEPLTSRSMLPISPSGYPFYSMPSSGWIDVTEAEGNVLSGFQYVKAGTWSETLFALSADSTHKIVPQIPEPGYWETTVTLINPNDAENVIRFHLRKAGEDLSEDTELRLAPNEKRVVTLHDQYGKSSDDPLHSSILDISAELPVAGYYTFASPNDKADLPLPDSDDLKTDLIMPHYAGNDGFWWTGVGVFNPSESDLTIQGTPYDINGQEMASAGQQIVLFPGEYDVFTVKDRFGENIASEIAFIKFAALEGEKFGGFYLYGNLTNEMLSGANMR
ncbi:hypothetical protein [Desulfonema ishimotonii]|uniref:hypothetical protein n=1 Tax=Desulfonema ishimotonii TaxID=45657 RepID=UPI0014091768|nr:hypothetical protein [Desulfonema ishimotonii]